MSAPAVDLWVLNILDGNQFPGHWNFQAPLAVIEGDSECKKEIRLNTANLQLEGLIMAVAALSDTLTAKGVLTHQEMSAALGQAERAVEQDDDHELSDPNRAATLFPIRVLLLANEAAQRGKKFTFSDYAELVGKLT